MAEGDSARSVEISGQVRRAAQAMNCQKARTLYKYAEDVEMRMSGMLVAAILAIAPAAAIAAEGMATADVNMRAGPGTRFPVVDLVPDGAHIDIHGCLKGDAWCDVSWNGDRGWVSAQYLDYFYNNNFVYLPDYVDIIDIPVVPFELDTYWSDYYSGRPWYHRRAYWNGYWRRHARFAAQRVPRGRTVRHAGSFTAHGGTHSSTLSRMSAPRTHAYQGPVGHHARMPVRFGAAHVGHHLHAFGPRVGHFSAPGFHAHAHVMGAAPHAMGAMPRGGLRMGGAPHIGGASHIGGGGGGGGRAGGGGHGGPHGGGDHRH